MEAKITKVLERNEFDSVVEVQITVRSVIREGGDIPDMTFNGDVDIMDHNFVIAVHETLEEDPIMIAEMERICD